MDYAYRYAPVVIQSHAMMMKKLTVYICLLCLFHADAATEYRTFKDTQGRTVQAQVMDYDADTETVTIKRKAGRTVKVSIYMFCEADQTYIRNIHQAELSSASAPDKVSTPPGETLTRKQIKDLARQYIEALKEQDTETVERLLLAPIDSEIRRSLEKRLGSFKGVMLGHVTDKEAYIYDPRFSKSGIGHAGWLQFTAEGRIKYCPYLFPHPVESAAGSLIGIASINNTKDSPMRRQSIKVCVDRLKRQGVPAFELESIGWDTDKSPREIEKCIKTIRAWLIENGESYDISEPKMYLPEKQFRVVKAALSSAF